MANAMREISLDQGLDPRSMTLLPFGGAGPLMGTLLADELGIHTVIIPPLAGNFSAWGLLGADMVQSAARTRVIDFAHASLEEINLVFAELWAALERRSSVHARSSVRSGRLDLRFKGQEHWLSIEVPIVEGKVGEAVKDIKSRFLAEYNRTFGATMNEEVELVSIRANTTVPLPRRKLSYRPKRADGASATTMEVFSFEKKQRVPFRIVPRGKIEGKIQGPAIVTEDTTTTYVDVEWTIENGSAGELILKRAA